MTESGARSSPSLILRAALASALVAAFHGVAIATAVALAALPIIEILTLERLHPQLRR